MLFPAGASYYPHVRKMPLASDGNRQVHRRWMNGAGHVIGATGIPGACRKAGPGLDGRPVCAAEVRRATFSGGRALHTNHKNMFGATARRVRKRNRAALGNRNRGGAEGICPQSHCISAASAGRSSRGSRRIRVGGAAAASR